MIKINLRLSVFAFITSFFILTQAQAQTGSLSPYSRYGIGELRFSGFASQRAMGGLGAALQLPGRLNFSNPATYAVDTLTTAEIGVEGMLEKLSDANTSINKKNGNMSYLSLGFPIVKHHWGMSIGITPYSAVGYDITERDSKANYFYQGSGSINRFYIGNGFKITKNFYAGFNASYLFGSINRARKVEFYESSFYSNRYITSITVSDILLDFGLQYRLRLKSDYNLMVGVSGSNSNKIHAKRTLLWENYVVNPIDADITSARDTVEYIHDEKGNITFPTTITGGLYFSKSNNWGIGAEVNYQDWSNYKVFDETETLDKGMRIAVGGQWIPDAKSLKYFNRAEYRIGGFYNQGYLKVKNTAINETALTAGIGLPLRKSFQSMVNISFEFGERGTIKDNLVKERYGKVFIGITFNEDWFHKRRYD